LTAASAEATHVGRGHDPPQVRAGGKTARIYAGSPAKLSASLKGSAIDG
jgi:hypothetical protein